MSEQPRPERRASRREATRRALERRLREVWSERIARLAPAAYQAEGGFFDPGSELKARASDAPDASLSAYLYETETSRWMRWEGDCLQALILLSTGRTPRVAPSRPPQAEPFICALRELRRAPGRYYQLLAERYACPLNVSRDSEREVRERILEDLMVRDRARIEKGSEVDADLDDVLLKLSLMAVYATAKASTDLRYLDALNYYYEILPERCRGGRAPLLYASYLALYARALFAWLNWKL